MDSDGGYKKILGKITKPAFPTLEPVPLEAHDAAVPVEAPIISSYNDRIRPLLDIVDRLRNLNVMNEGIQLPTIVVVGDQSSGKSSVLESLARISLPRGQGTCTRVPLVLRLRHHPTLEPEIWLEFNEKKVRTDEEHIMEAISNATDEIAGSGKGISDVPINLVVRANGVPDLTMVDLPGITRVPIRGQPDNIYELIAEMIMKYIEPQDSIILNVLSATVDFSTCESIRMSRQVDKTRRRTLAVVTKADKAPEGLHEKIVADDVSIGLGYVCVRNRINGETYEEARKKEALLFETHPLLSKIDKAIVGVPVLAQKLMQIQAKIIARCLPEIVKKVTEKLDASIAELNKMPKVISSVPEAMVAVMQVIGNTKESLRKILIQGEFQEYPDDKNMHCTARLAGMLNHFSDELQLYSKEKMPGANFLMEEIKVLEEGKGIGLPNFLPRSAFLTILHRRVKGISEKPVTFISQVLEYIENVLVSVLMQHSEKYAQLQPSARKAAHNLVSRMKDWSIDRVTEMVEMEKLTDYTCNPEYMSEWSKLMSNREHFVTAVLLGDYEVRLKGFGEIDVTHLRPYHHQVLHQAFDLKMRMMVYWEIVLRRLVDNVALHVQYLVMNLVGKEMEEEMMGELVEQSGGGIQRVLEEAPAMVSKREKLESSVKILEESKELVTNILDRIQGNGD